jgi:hypothetical protein
MMEPMSAGITSNTAGQAVIDAVALSLAFLLPRQATESGSSRQNAEPSAGKSADAQGVRARWRNQQIVARKAEAEYHNARLTREIAEIGVEQYIECIFPQELASVDAEIKRAESDLKRAQDRLDWVRNNSYKGFPPDGSAISDELGVRKASFALEEALSKKKVLVDFKNGKRVKELKGEVDKARSNELAKKAAWALEKLKESAIEQQIAQWQVMVSNRGEMKGPSSQSVRGAFRKEARAVLREIPIRQLATGVRSARSGSAGLPVMARGVAESHAADNENRG